MNKQMKCAISLFLETVDDKIRRRGEEYYTIGNVIEVVEESKDNFIAEVDGSDDEPYRTWLQIKGDEVCDWGCNCPYDFGDVCKHTVAVLYALLNDDEVCVPYTETATDLKALLLNLPKDRLVGFLMDMAKQDRRFKSNLFVLVGKPDKKADMSTAKKLLSKAEKAIEITYYDGFETANKVCKVIGEAMDFAIYRIKENVIMPAYTIFSGILKQFTEMDSTLFYEFEMYDYEYACVDYLLQVCISLKKHGTINEINIITNGILSLFEKRESNGNKLDDEEKNEFYNALKPVLPNELKDRARAVFNVEK